MLIDYTNSHRRAPLLDTQWLLRGEAIPGSGALLEWEVSITNAPKCFYRLNVE